MGVLETHDDGERDGPALAVLCVGRGYRDPGADRLRVVRGVDRGRHIGRYRCTGVTGEGVLVELVWLRTRILEERDDTESDVM